MSVMTWGVLPDDVLHLIMYHYKNELHERMATRTPQVEYYGSGKTYCEMCDKKKKKVAWFCKSYRMMGGTCTLHAHHACATVGQPVTSEVTVVRNGREDGWVQTQTIIGDNAFSGPLKVRVESDLR